MPWTPPTLGQLTEKVVIQQDAGAENALGTRVPFWADVATVWAMCRDVSSQERFVGQMLQGERTAQVTIRYRSDVKVAWRVKWGARLLDIQGIEDPQGDRRWLILTCSEVVS